MIARYADRVKILLTENATQRVAANRGYAMTTGDVVIFLDSDDVLPPDLPTRLADVWTPRVSKVQFQVRRVNEAGEPIGAPFPAYRPPPTPADIRRWVSRTSAYPTPPGSGNAYAKWFLDVIFPVGPSVGDASDSACLAAAPFFGDVVSVPGVVVGYRQHTANDSDMLADPRRLAREVLRARGRWRYAQHACGVPDDEIDERPLFRSREVLQQRVASRRLVPAEPTLPGDGWFGVLMDVVRSPFQIGPEPLVHRALVALWALAVLLSPLRIARLLITHRYGRGR